MSKLIRVLKKKRNFVPKKKRVHVSDALYCGVHARTGGLKLLIEGKRKVGFGELYLLGSVEEQTGPTVKLPELKLVVPGIDFDAKLKVRLYCRCNKSGTEYLFCGYIEDYWPKEIAFTAPVDVLVPQLGTPAVSPDESQEIVKTPLKPKRASTVRCRPTFDEELRRICSMRDAGLDPDLDMNFLIGYLPEGRATIYRKLKKKQFPPPLKRGGKVIWRLSVIEKYRLGQWVGKTDMDPAAGSMSRETAPTPSNTRKPANDGAHGEKTGSAVTLTVAGTHSGI